MGVGGGGGVSGLLATGDVLDTVPCGFRGVVSMHMDICTLLGDPEQVILSVTRVV